MRIPARVAQWVKLTKKPLPFKHWSDLFKSSCLKSLLPIQRYYLKYIIYYQHCHIDRESIFRRAKTNVVVAAPSTLPIAACATAVVATMTLTCSWSKCIRCAVLVNDPQHALFLCLAGPTPFWARVLSFLTIFQGDVYLGSTMHCYDILSGGASVTGYSDLRFHQWFCWWKVLLWMTLELDDWL